MSPVLPVSQSNYFANYFRSRNDFTDSLRGAYYAAAAPAKQVIYVKRDVYDRLIGYDPWERAEKVREVKSSSLSAEDKSFWVGLLYATYRIGADRMKEIRNSTLAFTEALPARLAQLGTDVYTPLKNLSWDSFKSVFITIARLAAGKFNAPMPDLYVRHDPNTSSIAYYEADKNKLVVNTAKVKSNKDLAAATAHELRHAQQKGEKFNNPMIAENDRAYFPGGMFYPLQPVEQEALATSDIVNEAFPAMV